MTGPSVVGPVSNRSRPRPWTTGSALAFPEVAQNPLFGLVLARDPDLSAASGGPSSRRGPRPGSARSCAWARTRTRGGPGRWPGDASPSRGCAPTRRRARSASGRPPPPAARVFPWSPAWSEPSRVSPARGSPRRPAGRSRLEARSDGASEPPAPVVAPDRAHAARTTSVARLGAQGGTVLARPAAVGIVARRPPDAAPRCTSPRSGARRRTYVRPSRRRGRSRAAEGSGPWRRPGRRSSRAPRARPCRPRAGCSRALSAWRAPFPCPRPPAGPPSRHPSGSPCTLRLPCLPPPRRWWNASRAWQRLRLN